MNYVNAKTDYDKVFRSSSRWWYSMDSSLHQTMNANALHMTDPNKIFLLRSLSNMMVASRGVDQVRDVLWRCSFKTKIVHLTPTLYKLTVIQITKCQSLSDEWDRKLIDAQNIAKNSFTLERTSALGRKIMQAKLSKEKKKSGNFPSVFKKCSSLFGHFHVAEKGIA